MDEIFYQKVEAKSRGAAKREYIKHALSLLFSYGIKRRKQLQKKYPKTNGYIMNKSYFTIAYRSLKKQKLFSIIRLGNLMIGLAISLLCWIYVRYEVSYEKFFPNYQNVYRLQHETPEKLWAAVPRAAGVFAYETFPDVKSMVRLSPSSTLVRHGEEIFMEENILSVDSTMFEVFQYTFIAGNPFKALTDPLSTVITESTAKKYFGSTDVVGEQLTFEFDRGEHRIITGVIKDPPTNSHITFDFLVSIYAENPEYNRSWSNWGTYAYLLMNPEADFESIGKRIGEEYIKQYNVEGEVEMKIEFLPLANIHLHSHAEKELSVNANVNYLYIFSFAGIFVLIISILNFINLTMAGSLDRRKEVGLRKSIGASKGSLVFQFLSESYLQVLVSSILSIGLLYLMLPFFRSLSGLPLNLDLTNSEIFIPVLITIAAIGFICGIYPALAISRFKPTEILKPGYANKTNSASTRKVLSILQFAISVILIIGSIIIYRQSEFIRERDLGFNKDQVLYTSLNYSINQNLEAFQNKIRDVPGVIEVAHSSSIPGYRIMREPVADIASGFSPTVRLLLASESLIESLDIELVEGRSFTKNGNQEKFEWILNEEAVKYYTEGKDIKMLGRDLAWGRDTAEVVGIVKNFNFETLHEEVSPLAILREPRAMRHLSIRYEADKTDQVLAGLAESFDEVYPNLPNAEFEFLSDHFATLYAAEKKLQTLVFIFCSISLLLTISGIFGITVYFTQRKTKEIAIRKVLGSSVLNVTGLIFQHFIGMIIISLIISLPASYFLSQWWLAQFAYKIEPGIITFIIGCLSIIIIVVASSSYSTLKTAKTNPVRWLRNE